MAYTILCLLHHLWLPEFQWCIQQTALFHLNLSRSTAVEACDLPKVSCKFLTFFALVRSSCWRVFCKKVLLKALQNSQENSYAAVSFSIKWRASGSLVSSVQSPTVAFLWILRNFKSSYFCRISTKGCF